MRYPRLTHLAYPRPTHIAYSNPRLTHIARQCTLCLSPPILQVEFEAALRRADVANGRDGQIALPYWDWTQEEEAGSGWGGVGGRQRQQKQGGGGGEVVPEVIRRRFPQVREHHVGLSSGVEVSTMILTAIAIPQNPPISHLNLTSAATSSKTHAQLRQDLFPDVNELSQRGYNLNSDDYIRRMARDSGLGRQAFEAVSEPQHYQVGGCLGATALSGLWLLSDRGLRGQPCCTPLGGIEIQSKSLNYRHTPPLAYRLPPQSTRVG